MIAVDMGKGALFHDAEIKDAMAAGCRSATGSARSMNWTGC